MHHVLEHTPNPDELLTVCTRLLRPGGLLVTALPNIESLQAALGKERWFHLDLPYHLYHFSERGLIRILENHGFRIASVRRFDLEHNPFGWLQTLLNISGIRENFLFDLLKCAGARRNEYPRVGSKDMLLTFALLPLFAPLSVLFSALESFILKRGGTIEVFATKGRTLPPHRKRKAP